MPWVKAGLSGTNPASNLDPDLWLHVERDLTLTLPSACSDQAGKPGAGRVCCGSSGEGIYDNLAELLGSELSLRASKIWEHREGTPGRGDSLDTGRQVGRETCWASQPAQLDKEMWGGQVRTAPGAHPGL